MTGKACPSCLASLSAGKKDCGVPLANETKSYKLPTIESLASLPRNFNPELTCSADMARQVGIWILHLAGYLLDSLSGSCHRNQTGGKGTPCLCTAHSWAVRLYLLQCRAVTWALCGL